MSDEKMDESQDLGPMNIWCEFKEDPLKTLLSRKIKVGPLVPTNVTNG